MKKKTNNGQGGAAPATDVENAKTQLVRIEFYDPTAFSVCIAGTFNDWHPDATRMIGLGSGRWSKELILPPGTYEYRLVVNGRWIADPGAVESTPIPFGGVNSVLHVRWK